MKSIGVCEYCNKTFSERGMEKHILSCVKRKSKLFDCGVNAKGKVYLIRANSSPFFIYFEVNADSTLQEVDSFLRDIWLECCGHLSLFKIENNDYDSSSGGDFFGENKSKIMEIKLSNVLRPDLVFSHEYDFGSTTHLNLKVILERPGSVKDIEIISRNNMPDFRCECGELAKEICTECIYEGNALFCEGCAKKHKCDEEMFLPVVNSPRMGICGYTGN